MGGMSIEVECDRCGHEFPLSALHDVDGVLLCPACATAEIDIDEAPADDGDDCGEDDAGEAGEVAE